MAKGSPYHDTDRRNVIHCPMGKSLILNQKKEQIISFILPSGSNYRSLKCLHSRCFDTVAEMRGKEQFAVAEEDKEDQFNAINV